VIHLINIPISLLPVVAFHAMLMLMDSFKLVSFRSVNQAIGVGALAAAVSFGINVWLVNDLGVDLALVRQLLAPIVEETLKCLYIVFLIRTLRVGFMVDAAIYGFTVGTGFALLENIYYLQEFGDSSVFLWIVRGFGTAIMHGSTTALFAIVTKGISDRNESTSLPIFLPGLLLALAVHILYNQFILHPLIETTIFLVALPLLVIFVFDRSERATREWLGVGFDTDVELLELVHSGEIKDTRIGHYLKSLKSRFPAIVVADMLCLLQIHLELSVRAKGILMAREAGVPLEPDATVRANLEELKYLEKSVGKTGMLAILPFINFSSRDLWQLYMLRK
jgi:RsiW-degrading membrane proteinase PrsW (M82 family)